MTQLAATAPATLAPPALAELSELLGVAVRDVELSDSAKDGLRHWYLVVALDRDYLLPLLSRELRSETGLNRVMGWRRFRGLPPLTKADGRRVLRLMHEHVEAKAGSGLDNRTTTTKENER
jgi:hypothetical protein